MIASIERLDASHDYRQFRCGEHSLDYFLKRHALANDRRGLGATYVAVSAERQVLGYVTICASSVSFHNMPLRELPAYPVPAFLIARLAVDRRAQGQGVGTELVLMALKLATEVADRIGLLAVTVDALNDEAARMYRQRFGFGELLDDPRHLFITIADLKASGL